MQIKQLANINIANIFSVENMRPVKHDEELDRLVQSMSEIGLINPIQVKPAATEKDYFQVVAGHSRLEAAKLLGWQNIPAIVIEENVPTDIMNSLTLAENVVRNDPSVLQVAHAVGRLFDKYPELKLDSVGRRLGLSPAKVLQLVRLAKLPDEYLEMLDDGHANTQTTAGPGPRHIAGFLRGIDPKGQDNEKALEHTKEFISEFQKGARINVHTSDVVAKKVRQGKSMGEAFREARANPVKYKKPEVLTQGASRGITGQELGKTLESNYVRSIELSLEHLKRIEPVVASGLSATTRSRLVSLVSRCNKQLEKIRESLAAEGS